MTKVTFYSNLTDKQTLLLKLVQGAVQKKHSVTILAGSEKACADISDALWHGEPAQFLPNVLTSDRLAAETPVVLGWDEKELNQDDILINVTQQQPRVFSRFQQLIELVTVEDEDKLAARERFKFYRDRGYEIKHIDYQAQ